MLLAETSRVPTCQTTVLAPQ